MFNAWFSLMLLAVEANEVITLRMLKMGLGGADAWDEARLMMSEKIGAGLEAVNSVMTGGLPLAVVERYRELVAVNAIRLVTPKFRPVGEQELVGILQSRTGMLPTRRADLAERGTPTIARHSVVSADRETALPEERERRYPQASI